MSRPWKITLTLLLILTCGVGWFAFQLFGPSPPIVVSKETTYITEPLADDGLPDYAAYLLAKGREGVTVENNAAVPFLQAMWPAELEEEHRAPLCEELGMAVPARRGMTRPEDDTELDARLLRWLSEAAQPPAAEGATEDIANEVAMPPRERVEWYFEIAYSQPWSRDEIPLLADWIDDRAEHYELLHQAADRSAYFCPFPMLMLQPKASVFEIGEVQSFRSAAVCLSARGMRSVGEGNVAAAWRDCEAIYRLSGHLAPNDVVTALVAIALDSLGDGLTLAILDSPDLDRDTARHVLDFQKSRQPKNNMADAIDVGERLMFITAMHVYGGQRPRLTEPGEDFIEEELDFLKQFSIDWNVVLAEGNTWYDDLVTIGRNQDAAARDAELDRFEHRVVTAQDLFLSQIPGATVNRKQRGEAVANMMVGLYFPVLGAAFQSEDRGNSYLPLHTVAAALAVYRMENNAYPDSLDELVPGLLAALPQDPYGNDLAYRRTDQGYLLYTLGLNGIDEKGSHELYQRYQGYELDYRNEGAIRQLLGMPEEEEVDDADLRFGSPEGLDEKIPADADDFGIRLPVPKVELPLP